MIRNLNSADVPEISYMLKTTQDNHVEHEPQI